MPEDIFLLTLRGIPEMTSSSSEAGAIDDVKMSWGGRAKMTAS